MTSAGQQRDDHVAEDRHEHREPGVLRADLSAEEATFASALKETHQELKLATLVAAGATLLFDQERLSAAEFRGRIGEAQQVYVRGVDRAAGLPPPAEDSRQRDYLDAAGEVIHALGVLHEAAEIAERRERRERCREATDRLAKANLRMREIGETLWEVEYVPLGSEGVYHTH